MEADWSAEIGAEAAEIVVPWQDWVDLRAGSDNLDGEKLQIPPEITDQPELAEALRSLNAPASRWMTSKCDFWRIESGDEAIDPFEFDAADLAGGKLCGCACYIDVLARDPQLFASFPAQENWLRGLTRRLRAQPLRHARVDLVLRAASYHDEPGFAMTAYAAGCGADDQAAQSAWSSALTQLVECLLQIGPS
jgi:hypothetical protein